MVKLAVSVTVFLFILAFSHAFSVSATPENDVIINDLSTNLPEHRDKNRQPGSTIPRVENRQPGSATGTVVELKYEIYGSRSRSAVPADENRQPCSVDPEDENRQPGSAVPRDENRQPDSAPGTDNPDGFMKKIRKFLKHQF